ncbi:MAG: hypothetical protein K2X46_04975 [Roseomonas sp.]|nr:hypothetical protein [Roseomonas sp.]
MDNDDGLSLSAVIPAVELGRLRRRVAFLEAALVQVLRDERQVREWFTAGELAALALPGLPATASGIARLAKRERWEPRITMGRGGERVVFHFSDLPRAAFAELLARVMRGGDGPDGLADDSRRTMPFPALAGAPVRRAQAHAENATPQWLLPLVRIIRGGVTRVEDAVEELATALAPWEPCPTIEEARETLRAYGVAVA